MRKRWHTFLAVKYREYGKQFDASALSKQFIPFFENGQRIKVCTHGEEITGTVGVTTGWKPVFLLMRTARSLGSVYTLSDQDTIIAIQKGKGYVKNDHRDRQD